MGNCYKVNKWFVFAIGICILVGLSSCGSSKVLYNPVEVEQLSRSLSIPIKNDDPNIPLYAEASLWLGVPYRYNGNSKSGSDCSGFVSQVYQRVYGKKLQRSSENQAKKDVHKVRKGGLKTGDLVFFSTSPKSKNIDHVGIFLKDGYFIHASTSRGVIVSHLEEDYYKKTWKKGGRVKL
ncbi:lipoprotein Spr [Dysgonomonas alginatilytica]|uniref:Lipoprotein Spr n=1 Tax=Dysgonomonas alginatilytica TaxID=1605892 RepID=A0A2V3PMF6_9BACT|nr:NlpC/P60 family protein [Dysgonomonas alginatilytica]PXV62677.1 lipoprotein Spr [Dysgonomonas alginatilytica]